MYRSLVAVTLRRERQDEMKRTMLLPASNFESAKFVTLLGEPHTFATPSTLATDAPARLGSSNNSTSTSANVNMESNEGVARPNSENARAGDMDRLAAMNDIVIKALARAFGQLAGTSCMVCFMDELEADNFGLGTLVMDRLEALNAQRDVMDIIVLAWPPKPMSALSSCTSTDTDTPAAEESGRDARDFARLWCQTASRLRGVRSVARYETPSNFLARRHAWMGNIVSQDGARIWRGVCIGNAQPLLARVPPRQCISSFTARGTLPFESFLAEFGHLLGPRVGVLECMDPVLFPETNALIHDVILARPDQVLLLVGTQHASIRVACYCDEQGQMITVLLSDGLDVRHALEMHCTCRDGKTNEDVGAATTTSSVST